MTIELSHEEVETLRNLIEGRVRELGPEIHHTDSREYRHGLEELRETLTSIEERLAAPTGSVA